MDAFSPLYWIKPERKCKLLLAIGNELSPVTLGILINVVQDWWDHRETTVFQEAGSSPFLMAPVVQTFLVYPVMQFSTP